MSPIHAARGEIEIKLDNAHRTAATIFILAARRQLKPFDLRGHQLFFRSQGGKPRLVVKDLRGDERYWWELGRAPHAPGSVFQAIAEIGATLDDDISESVAEKLSGVVL